MSSDVVVALYRERMQIEQSFRDFKTHLGMRGLKWTPQMGPYGKVEGGRRKGVRDEATEVFSGV